jgi:hypothetical protein
MNPSPAPSRFWSPASWAGSTRRRDTLSGPCGGKSWGRDAWWSNAWAAMAPKLEE